MAKVVLTSLKTKNFSDNDIDNAVERAIDGLDFNFTGRIQNLVIKPNLCYYWNYSTGETTDPRVVSAVIDYVRRKVGKDVSISIVEADASAMKTKHSFDVLGYREMCRRKQVDLVNLCEGNIEDVNVTVKDKELVLPVNKLLLQADLVINVPKLKTHNLTGVTCAFKNMFGAIAKPRKYSYHSILSYAIVGVNKKVRSDLTIVDGIVARGRHPKRLGLIMAADDPLANDFVAARIMGFNPRRVEHLLLAAREHVWQTNEIEVVEDGVKLSEVKKNFPSYNHMMHRLSWNLQLRLLRLYGKIVGDVLPPVLED